MTPSDASARQQALDVRHNHIVRAPAGSGKTELLVQRCLAGLAVATQPESVLAITFTVKAANEIRERLYGALTAACAAPPTAPHRRQTWDLAFRVLERDRALGWNLIDDPSRLQTMTIDSLNARLVRQMPILSGMGGASEALDNPQLAYQQAVAALFAEYENDSLESEVREALGDVLIFADNNIDRLTPMFCSMLEKREQWRDLMGSTPDVHDEQDVLMSLIESRLAELASGVPAGLIDLLIVVQHMLCPSGVPAADGDSRSLSTDVAALPSWKALASVALTAKGTWRKRLTKREGFERDDPATPVANAALQSLKETPDADTLARRLHAIANLPSGEYPDHTDRLRRALSIALSRCTAHLMLAFNREAGVDFAEIGLRAHIALQGGADQDLSLLERHDRQLEHLLVDEFQDTSRLQIELVETLTSGWEPGDGRSVFLVGDPQQSIYAFRQAEVREFMSIWDNEQIGELDLVRVSLTENFRSTPEIVNACNAILSTGFPETSDSETGVVAMLPAVSAHGTDASSWVRMAEFDKDDRKAEAEHAADVIEARLAESAVADIAVLVRAKRHAGPVMDALARRGIAYTSQDMDVLGQGGAAADVIALIRALWHAGDRGAWVGVLRSPFVGLSHRDVLNLCAGKPNHTVPDLLADAEQVAAVSTDGQARISRLNHVLAAAWGNPDVSSDLCRLARSCWFDLDGPDCVDADEQRDVSQVFEVLREQSRAGQLDSLTRFVSRLEQLYANTSTGRVQIMTIHKAKGLEFDTVLLLGAGRATANADRPLLHRIRTDAGTLTVPRPPRSADSADPAVELYEFAHGLASQVQRNEGMRLLYVAMTRAKTRLHVLANTAGGRPARYSLVEPVWDALGAFVDPDTAPAAALNDAIQGDRFVPCPPRLPADHRSQSTVRDVQAPVLHRTAPSERVFRSHPVREPSPEDGESARILGVLYHRVMELRSRQPRPLDFSPEALSNSLAALARREGLAEPDVPRIVSHVIRLLDNTCSSQELRDRIFSAGREVVAEYQYTGCVNGQWTTGVMDLVSWSAPHEKVVWLLDYKASLAGAVDNPSRLIKGLAHRYRPQLSEYADGLRTQYPGWDVRTALFIPEYGHFEPVAV